MNQTSSKKFPEWIYPLALLVIALGVYGPFLSQLGYYWDDWVFAWERVSLGAPGMLAEFAKTRPMRGYIEIPFTFLFGANPLAWQVYGVFIRWLAASAFWYFLRQLWPGRRAGAVFAAALILVYPGFTQQPLAMTYHYFWLFCVVLFASLILMLFAVRREHVSWGWYAAALLLSGLQMFSSEYMITIELLRPVFLWLGLSALAVTPSERLKKTVIFETPFALLLALYFFWRFILFKNPMYSPVISGASLLSLPGALAKIFVDVNLNAWLQTTHWPDFSQVGTLFVMAYVLVFLGFLVGWPIFAHKSDVSRPDSSAWDWVILGIIGMLLAGIPFLMAGLPFRLAFPEDRFTLSFLPFVGLFVAGLLELLPNQSNRYLVAGLLLALAFNFQFQMLITYRDDWRAQKNYLWQLAWRAPHLASGTTLLSEDYDTFRFNDDEAFTPIINWMYVPHQASAPSQYHYAFISRYAENLPEMLQNTPPQSTYLVTRYSPPGCLHIFDPAYDEALLSLPTRQDVTALAALNLPVIPALTLQAVPLSNPALTTGGSLAARLPDFLGPEPAHGWCYTYLKADLARQQGNWQEVARLGEAAFAVPTLPDDPYEYLPFIEAYARLGRIKDARLLTRQVAESMPLLKPALCGLWSRLSDVPAGTVQEIRQELQACPVNP